MPAETMIWYLIRQLSCLIFLLWEVILLYFQLFSSWNMNDTNLPVSGHQQRKNWLYALVLCLSKNVHICFILLWMLFQHFCGNYIQLSEELKKIPQKTTILYVEFCTIIFSISNSNILDLFVTYRSLLFSFIRRYRNWMQTSFLVCKLGALILFLKHNVYHTLRSFLTHDTSHHSVRF